jgi:hypothetical protein
MHTLPAWFAATITWVILVTTADRLADPLELGALAYALSAAGLLFIVVPTLRRLSTLWVLAFAFPIYCILKVVSGARIDFESSPAVILEFAVAAVTIFLASRVGRKLALFEEAVKDLALAPAGPPAERFARNQGEMFREVRRARRHQRPLSMLAVSAAGGRADATLAELLALMQRENADRLLAARVARLLSEETSGSAVVAERGDHFVVLLPETSQEAAALLAQRLEDTASHALGVQLRFGLASFPTPEVTFDKLVESAVSGLRDAERAVAGDERHGHDGGSDEGESPGAKLAAPRPVGT